MFVTLTLITYQSKFKKFEDFGFSDVFLEPSGSVHPSLSKYVFSTNLVVVYYRTRTNRTRTKKPERLHTQRSEPGVDSSKVQNSGFHRRTKKGGCIKRKRSDRKFEKGILDKINNVKKIFQRPWTSRSGLVHPSSLRGLMNLHNTCFANAALQCLAYTPPLAEYLLSDFSNDINKENIKGTKGELVVALSNLIKEMRSSGVGPVDPSAFMRKVSNFGPRFGHHDQQDLQDFLEFLLDRVEEDLNRVKQKPNLQENHPLGCTDKEIGDESWRIQKLHNDSVIDEIFRGQYRSKLICKGCSDESVRFDAWMCLALPLPSDVNATNMISCLEEFLVGQDSLDENILWICPACKVHRQSRKIIDLWRLPEIITFQLKRFVFKEGVNEKINSDVSFPLRLDLSPYVKSEEACFGGSCVYEIYAVCNHDGNLFGGHYTACCKIMGTWYSFNDIEVSQVREADLQTPAAYLLFYRRVKRDQPDSKPSAAGTLLMQQNVSESSSIPPHT